MNKKIIGIFVCMLLTAITVLPVMGSINIYFNECVSQSLENQVIFAGLDSYEEGATVFENSFESTDVILARSFIYENVFFEIPPSEFIVFYPDGSHVGSSQFTSFLAVCVPSPTTVTYTVTDVSQCSSGPTADGPWTPIKAGDKLETCTWYKRDVLICSSLNVTDQNGNKLTMPHTDTIQVCVPHHVPNDPRFENVNQYEDYADFNYASFDFTSDFCIASGNTMIKEGANIGLRTEIAEAFIPQRGSPAICCEGNLKWTNVKPGDTVSDTFQVCNCGDPGTYLNWMYYSAPPWGVWEITPDSGSDLAFDDCVTITATVTAPSDPGKEFVGYVRMINSDNPAEFCMVSVSLSTPRSKAVSFPFLQLFEKLLVHFPVLIRLLNI